VLTEGEGARGEAWQRMTASSGGACSPATGDRGAGDDGSGCSGVGERRPGEECDGKLAPGEAGGGGVRSALTRGNDGFGAQLRTRAHVRIVDRKTGLYPCPWRRAVPPHSANRSKALHDTTNDKWALRVSDFPILINFEIDHSRGKNNQARRQNLEKFMEVGNPIWNTFYN
jgi:hypothetical protein